ncbi:hypothetical protein J4450_07485 [Candidatus Micrarchaeota archaeon]|nr:hypothetical protein [uncultured archaeon]MBS3068524.1 hypothetical protein [Candidatus Micrarchaeota archaeon]
MRRLSSGQCAVSHALRANDPFRRFQPEVAQQVRKLDITGQSYLERARKAREMLREMTAKHLLQVVEFRLVLNSFEVLALAKREDKLIAPIDICDKILTEIKRYLPLLPLTGTLIIYKAPDKPFGDKVTFFRRKDNKKVRFSISFKVPKQFQGLANCALAIDHPDFELIDLGNNKYEIKLVEGATIYLIENFPKKNGWYIPHPQTKIPQGKPVEESKEARRLSRSIGAYAYLLWRCSDGRGFDMSLGVDAEFGPFFRGEVVLVPLPAAEK